MRLEILTCIILLACSTIACKKTSGDPPAEGLTFEFNFSQGPEGWTGDFADYPNEPNVEQTYQLELSHSGMPVPLNPADGSLRQSGMNRSDDLFMFVKKKISGLVPLRTYSANLAVEFGTNVANNMAGIGGSPGEGVWIKAGAVTLEPLKQLSITDNYYRMNIDKGNQSQGGADMKVIGNFANGSDLNEYRLKKLSTASPLQVKADDKGELWLVIGTDSGFEGKTTIHYTSIKAILN